MPAKVLELLDMQTLQGQQVITRMHYVDPDGTGDPQTLVNSYIEDVIPAMASFQSAAVQHLSVKWRVVYPTADLTQETVLTTPVVGEETGGTQMPSYSTFSFKLQIGATVWLVGARTDHIKRGGKHLPGVVEGQVSGDSIIGAGTLAAAAAWVSAAKNPGSDVYSWCVATFRDINKRAQHTVQGYTIVAGATPPSPGTQNTRKIIRGRVG